MHNGFKVGYLSKLGEMMKKAFPTTDLKGSPHINSRLGSWKKNYYSLAQILSRSGVGFNLEDDQWDQIVKRDSNARLMRYKSWPYYEDWKEIFGKNRANGEIADDYMGVENAMREEDVDVGGFNVSLEDEGNSVSNAKKVSATSSQSKGKKRKASEGMKELCDVLFKIGEKTDARLADLAKRIGYEYDLSVAQQEAFDMLGSIPNLSVDDKFDVCEILGKPKYELEIFMGLRGDARAMYVYHLLNNRGLQ